MARWDTRGVLQAEHETRRFTAKATLSSPETRVLGCLLEKQRTERMHAFAELADVHETLQRLIARELVTRLSRRPGQKEERYLHLLQKHSHPPQHPPHDPGAESR